MLGLDVFYTGVGASAYPDARTPSTQVRMAYVGTKVSYGGHHRRQLRGSGAARRQTSAILAGLQGHSGEQSVAQSPMAITRCMSTRGAATRGYCAWHSWSSCARHERPVRRSSSTWTMIPAATPGRPDAAIRQGLARACQRLGTRASEIPSRDPRGQLAWFDTKRRRELRQVRVDVRRPVSDTSRARAQLLGVKIQGNWSER